MDDCTFYDNCEPNFFERTFSWFGDLFGGLFDNWLNIFVALVVIGFLLLAVEVVSEKTARVVERFGKFNRVMHAGLRFRIPIIERVVEEMSLQIIQLEEDIKVKTQDNVFVTLPVVVQYRVQPDKVKEAYYELEEPEDIITSLVLNEVKSTSAGMSLESVFASRDHIETGVKNTLEERLGNYGYEIINVVVDNPELSEELEASYNSVMAAQREQDAATAQAEALKIRSIGEATANAEGLKINADAQVAYRNTLAEGNAAAVKQMVGDTGLSPQDVLRYFTVTDGNDAIRDAAGKGATVVVASPSHTDGLYATLNMTK